MGDCLGDTNGAECGHMGAQSMMDEGQTTSLRAGNTNVECAQDIRAEHGRV